MIYDRIPGFPNNTMLITYYILSRMICLWTRPSFLCLIQCPCVEDPAFCMDDHSGGLEGEHGSRSAMVRLRNSHLAFSLCRDGLSSLCLIITYLLLSVVFIVPWIWVLIRSPPFFFWLDVFVLDPSWFLIRGGMGHFGNDDQYSP